MDQFSGARSIPSRSATRTVFSVRSAKIQLDLCPKAIAAHEVPRPCDKALKSATPLSYSMRAAIPIAAPQVCARQRPPQFPLRPYTLRKEPFLQNPASPDANRPLHLGGVTGDFLSTRVRASRASQKTNDTVGNRYAFNVNDKIVSLPW